MIDRIVSSTNAITPTSDNMPDKKHDRQDHKDQGEQPHHQEPLVHDEQAADVAVSIRGIPLDELSPQGRDALVKMLEDFDRLRGEVNWGREKVRKLEKMADSHSFLPVINRRAFMRKLDGMLSLAGQSSTRAGVVLIHFANAGAIRRQRGAKAYQHFMDHVCQVLLTTLHPTDQLGSLGGNDFAIILMLGDDQTAEKYCQEIMQAFDKQPCFWAGEDLPVAVLVGWSAITTGKSPETVLSEADSRLLDQR